MGPKIAARDQSCRVTGFKVGTCAAYIVARNHAEQSGVPVEHVDHPANMIELLKELEQAYDRFEWCFDEQGAIHILYRYTPALMYLIPPARVHLLPECEGGPRLEYIRIAHRVALNQARERCPDCWLVRVGLRISFLITLFEFMFAKICECKRPCCVFYYMHFIVRTVRPRLSCRRICLNLPYFRATGEIAPRHGQAPS